MSSKMLIIIGASGHAKVVTSTALELGYEIKGYYDDNIELQKKTFLDKPVLGTIAELIADQNNQMAVIAIGDANIRQAIAKEIPNLNWVSLVHPEAYVDKTVKIFPGTVVFAGAVLQPYVVVEEHCIINTAATIDHDCHIGAFTHIAPGCHLAGGIDVGKGSLLGLGSVVLPNITIGEAVIIGAGAVVTKSIQSHAIAVGCPAQVIKSRE